MDIRTIDPDSEPHGRLPPTQPTTPVNRQVQVLSPTRRRSMRRFGVPTRWVAGVLTLVCALLAVGPPDVFAQTSPSASAPSAPASESEQDAARTRALERANNAVVGVESVSVEDAASATTLGRQRLGSGVVIGDDSLVLTIGYLILEADRIDLVDARGRRFPARVVAYDIATGFGLLQALAPLSLAPAPLGEAAALGEGDPLMVASGGSLATLSLARLISRRPFSGYWEYHIEGALFTAPARADHSGAGLFNADGELLGIGSLLVGDAAGTGVPGLRGNMFVPVDLLKPILAELRQSGTSQGSRRAWIGVNCVQADDHLRVIRVAEDSPAERAGLLAGDEILRIDGSAASSLLTFYRALWQTGGVERQIELRIRRADGERNVTVTTIDRLQTLKRPQGV